MSFNKVILSGRLTSEPEVKSTSSGILICNFSLAVNEYVKSQEYTSFFNCIAFGKTAERMQNYVKKGSLVGVEGSLRQNRWDDAEGNKRSKIEVIVARLEIFEWKKDGNQPNYKEQKEEFQNDSHSYSDFIEEENDIPF